MRSALRAEDQREGEARGLYVTDTDDLVAVLERAGHLDFVGRRELDGALSFGEATTHER